MQTDNELKLDVVAVISCSEEHLKRDKINLKEFRPRTIMAFASGGEALEVLAGTQLDLVLCDSNLGDMDSCKFMRILRQRPQHRMTPVIVVTLDATKDAVLDAISAGCTGYVLRPYSPETFHRHLVMAKQLERFSEIEEEQLRQAKDMVQQGDFDDAIEEFEEILSLQDEAQKYYDMGCDYLLKNKFGKAIISFNKALKINDLFAEAYQGLAEAYKGKGEMNRYKSYLQKAAEVHAQFDRLEEAKNLFIEVLKQDSEAPNPYNTLGVKLRRNGDYPGAVHAYKRAIELSPQDENIHYNLAKAFYYMGEIKKAQEKLRGALAINDDFPEALRFHKELFGLDYPRDTRRKAAAPAPKARAIKDV